MRGRALHADLFDWAGGVRSLADEVAQARRHIADIEVSPDAGPDAEKALEAKRALLADAELRTGRPRFFADLAVGALAHATGGERAIDSGSVLAARLIGDLSSGAGEAAALVRRRKWLDADRVDGGFAREPLHWPLVFPEVLEAGGFDAVIGNPPFLGGQKLTGQLGTGYREHLVHAVGHGARGSADLVAYFVLRAPELLHASGQAGLIATNPGAGRHPGGRARSARGQPGHDPAGDQEQAVAVAERGAGVLRGVDEPG